jgi:hypothetical protein
LCNDAIPAARSGSLAVVSGCWKGASAAAERLQRWMKAFVEWYRNSK